MHKHKTGFIVHGSWRVSKQDLEYILRNHFQVSDNALPAMVNDIADVISKPENADHEFWLESVHYGNHVIKSVALKESTKVKEYSRKG